MDVTNLCCYHDIFVTSLTKLLMYLKKRDAFVKIKKVMLSIKLKTTAKLNYILTTLCLPQTYKLKLTDQNVSWSIKLVRAFSYWKQQRL